MHPFIVWQTQSALGRRLDAERVAEAFGRLLAPLFDEPPEVSIRRNDVITALVAERPVSGWKAAFCEQDAEGWFQAIDYPIDARAALAAANVAPPPGSTLRSLCLGLQEDPARWIDQLAPPFSLIWAARPGEAFLQCDGAGQSQLFEFERGGAWAVTNRIMALAALGLPLEPAADDWAAYSVLRWFPLDLTGYRGVRRMAPGTQLQFSARGVGRRVDDVLSRWLHPPPISPADRRDMARSSLDRILGELARLNDRPLVDLSGGLDSRAIVSAIRKLGLDFQIRVKGQVGDPDVAVASKLAAISGFPLRIDQAAVLPPADPADMRQSIQKSLRWQGGHMDPDRHKSSFSRRSAYRKARVNVMGQYGEIGRGFLYPASFGPDSPESQSRGYPDGMLGDLLCNRFLKNAPLFLRPKFEAQVRDIMQAAYRQADRYGMAGLDRLNFFHLFEKSRRLMGASLASENDLMVAPFLNPNFIRASFASPPAERAADLLHHHIIASNMPDWAPIERVNGLPFARPGSTLSVQDGSNPRREIPYRGEFSRYYDVLAFWATTGTPLLQEALAGGGWTAEIFAVERGMEAALAAPDALTIVHVLSRDLAGISGDLP